MRQNINKEPTEISDNFSKTQPKKVVEREADATDYPYVYKPDAFSITSEAAAFAKEYDKVLFYCKRTGCIYYQPDGDDNECCSGASAVLAFYKKAAEFLDKQRREAKDAKQYLLEEMKQTENATSAKMEKLQQYLNEANKYLHFVVPGIDISELLNFVEAARDELTCRCQ